MSHLAQGFSPFTIFIEIGHGLARTGPATLAGDPHAPRIMKLEALELHVFSMQAKYQSPE